MNKLELWEDELTAAADHVVNVYDREAKEFARRESGTVKKDERIIERVKKEVELDAWFAEHHIDYLIRVIDKEAKRLAKTEAKITEAAERNDVQSVESLNERLSQQTVDSDKHITRVINHVSTHLERDAKAAARHISHGLKKISENQEELEENLEEASQKVIEAFQELLAKMNE